MKKCCPPSPEHQRCEEEKAPEAMVRPHPEGPHSSGSSTPNKGRKDDSVERSLATVCGAHQKVLAMVATLEEIERLSPTWNCSELRERSKSRDCQGRSREEQKRRCRQVWFKDQPAPSHSANPKTGPGEQGSNGKGSD